MVPFPGVSVGAWRKLSGLAVSATWAGLAATAVLMGLAAWLYPGGTWADPSRLGHAFWGNFWCDLLRGQALNGRPNRLASELATLAMVSFSVTLVAHWAVVAQRLAPAPTGRWVVGLGWLGSLGVTLVALTPSDRFPALHALAVLGAGPSLMGALVLGSLGVWRGEATLRWAAALAFGAVALALLNLVQYARQVYGGAPYAVWLPGIQKAATLCFVAWVLAIGWKRVAAAPAPMAHGPNQLQKNIGENREDIAEDICSGDHSRGAPRNQR